MVKIPFFKYQGLGNDFIIIDETHVVIKSLTDANPSLNIDKLKRLCDRRFGVGADGVVTMFGTSNKDADFAMHITNADGSVPEMCGNGLRAAARWLLDQKKLESSNGKIDTLAGVKSFVWEKDNCEVDMGHADFGSSAKKELLSKQVNEVFGQFGLGSFAVDPVSVSVGNPHLVLDNMLDKVKVDELGPLLSKCSFFPDQANVEFTKLVKPYSLEVSVWERGVGRTMACGTGACAAVAVWVKKGKIPVGQEVEVNLEGGSLWVRAFEETKDGSKEKLLRLTMRGPAKQVYWGEITL